MQMALEALEAHADIGIKADKAITAIKEALEQPAQSGLNSLWLATHPDKLCSLHNRVIELEQEASGQYMTGYEVARAEFQQRIQELEAQGAQPQQQEPVAIYQLQKSDGSWIDQDQGSYRYNKQHGHTVRIVYTTQPQRKPLTDEQIDSLRSFYQSGRIGSFVGLCRAIEAAHGITASEADGSAKEKNND